MKKKGPRKGCVPGGGRTLTFPGAIGRVRVGPAKSEIEAIPAAERSQWILQERCDFHPFFETPAGPSKAEIRVMFIGRTAVGLLVRMGRGAMMGVDQNKGQEWVGASAALWPAE